jgi:hypothetical protein
MCVLCKQQHPAFSGKCKWLQGLEEELEATGITATELDALCVFVVCYILVTLLLHSCYTVVILLSHYCGNYAVSEPTICVLNPTYSTSQSNGYGVKKEYLWFQRAMVTDFTLRGRLSRKALLTLLSLIFL